MARNLRQGSKVCFKVGTATRKGTVIKKFSARKGELDVPNNKRTVVEVKSSGQVFVKKPSQLRRCK